MKIALFGGRFDPPHNGHLAVAKSILRFDPSIDELWFMPVPKHHWKDSNASPEDRFNMVKLLEQGKIKASDFDIVNHYTFAIDTVKQLQKDTSHSYIWICGSDTIHDFHRWKDHERLSQLVMFYVVARNPYEITEVPKNFIVVKDPLYKPTNFSSTEIREKIKQRVSVDSLVPEKVVQYIKEKKLYL